MLPQSQIRIISHDKICICTSSMHGFHLHSFANSFDNYYLPEMGEKRHTTRATNCEERNEQKLRKRFCETFLFILLLVKLSLVIYVCITVHHQTIRFYKNCDLVFVWTCFLSKHLYWSQRHTSREELLAKHSTHKDYRTFARYFSILLTLILLQG